MPRCKCCNQKFAVKYFNQKFCMIENECIKAFNEELKFKQAKERQKKINQIKRQNQKEKKEWHEKNDSYAKRLGKARKVFQYWVRLRDKDESCISCGNPNAELYDGGHYLKAENYSGLIFEPLNCNKQCRKCNYFLDGNELNYREGLIKKIGEEKVLLLENSKDYNRVRKYSDEELKAIMAKYSALIKQIK